MVKVETAEVDAIMSKDLTSVAETARRDTKKLDWVDRLGAKVGA
jgi:hypothetical protein